MFKKVLLLVFAVIFLPACSIKYKAVGVFPDTNETLHADIDHNLSAGVAKVTATGDGFTCRGLSRVTYVPPFAFGCTGQRGDIEMVCTDGRTIRVDWQADSCTSGFGSGRDQSGNRVVLAYGGDEGTLLQRAGGGRAGSSGGGSSAGRSGPIGSGTGFFVSSDGLLVTNAHVVRGGKSFSIYTRGEETPAELVQVDPENDLALLKVDVQSRPIPLAAQSKPDKGEEVLTLGYPRPNLQGIEQKATFGRVNALTGAKGDVRFLQVDLPIQPGNSGGPLLNLRGEVIAVVTASLSEEAARTTVQNVNYAMKIDYLYPLLNVAAPHVRPSSGKGGMSVSDVVKVVERSVVLILARR